MVNVTPRMLGQFVRSLDELARKSLTHRVAAQLHGSWRERYRQPDNSFTPHLRPTTDEHWKTANGHEMVDLTNTLFELLPADWQAENAASAKVIADFIFAAALQEKDLMTREFMEEAAAEVHEKWLERNGAKAPESQKLPYAELSEEEKEEDRKVVRAGLRHIMMLEPQY